MDKTFLVRIAIPDLGITNRILLIPEADMFDAWVSISAGSEPFKESHDTTVTHDINVYMTEDLEGVIAVAYPLKVSVSDPQYLDVDMSEEHQVDVKVLEVSKGYSTRAKEIDNEFESKFGDKIDG